MLRGRTLSAPQQPTLRRSDFRVRWLNFGAAADSSAVEHDTCAGLHGGIGNEVDDEAGTRLAVQVRGAGQVCCEAQVADHDTCAGSPGKRGAGCNGATLSVHVTDGVVRRAGVNEWAGLEHVVGIVIVSA